MIIHISPSLGQNCGIALFAENIVKHLPKDAHMLIGNSFVSGHAYLLQHEYAIDKMFPWDQLLKLPKNMKKFVYMHSVSHLPHIKLLNERIVKWASDVIVCTTEMMQKLEAEYKGRIRVHVIEHFSEPLIADIKKFDDSKPVITLGMHGFAMPKSGYLKVIRNVMRYNSEEKKRKFRLFIAGTLSNISPQHLMISREYMDNCVSEVIRNDIRKWVELDTTYYNTKKEIAEVIRRKSDIVIIAQEKEMSTANTSGVIRTLMSSGVPVIAPDYIQFDGIPYNVVSRMKDSSDHTILEVMDNISEFAGKVDEKAVVEYIENTSIKKAAEQLDKLLTDIS